jgi:ribosomal protein S18 acetylase RimI-like enzyme
VVPNEPVIRPMTVEDLASVFRLGERCYDVLDVPYNYWSVPEVADHLSNHPALCYVAETEGKVVGFVLGADTFELLDNTGHLEWIAIDPDYRRLGLATRLVQTVLDVYQGLGKARVAADLATKNTSSQELVRGLGFTEGVSVTFFVKELVARR